MNRRLSPIVMAYDIRHILAINLHQQCFRPESRPAACRTGRIAAVTAEQHSIIDLVGLLLDKGEKTLDPVILAVPLHHNVNFLPGKLLERNVQTEPGRGCRSLQGPRTTP